MMPGEVDARFGRHFDVVVVGSSGPPNMRRLIPRHAAYLMIRHFARRTTMALARVAIAPARSHASTDPRAGTTVGASLALSWLGEFAHNRFELPQLTLLSPENSLPALVAVALFAAWWRRPGRVGTAVILAWGALHLVGGALLSVLPLPVWPFTPAQAPSHYGAHALYAVAQLPLLWVTAARFRAARPHRHECVAGSDRP